MREGVPLLSVAPLFSLSGRIPWMYLGMLVGGLPAMLPGIRSPRRPARSNGAARTSALGVTLGMSPVRTQSCAGPARTRFILLALGGMTIGMLIGMFFACAAGEAVAAAVLDRPSHSSP